MKLWKAWFSTPQPFRTFYIAFFFCIVFAIVASVATKTDASWPFLPFAIDAILIGVTMALNINGSADAASALAKQRRPFGMDQSISFSSSVTNARITGVGFILIGIFGCITSLPG